ncbi:MAG: sulfite exporter TauE/SafE family protein [Candidatus Omnitrophica bacterium]|nr:sulfite exporter TauE/SafE family protein [Candidatus Omnitrophota bacterium]
MQLIAYVLVGLAAGIASGFFGIGGGIIMIPAFLFLFGLTQHQAQGTSLAIMIPPIGLLAAMRYYRAGNVKVSIAIFACIGFFFGGYLGAVLANHIPGPMMKKVFGVLMMIISVKLIFGK